MRSKMAVLSEHLPGTHDQRSHGHRFGSGKASGAGFASRLADAVRREGGATIDVRKGSKDVTDGWLVAQQGKSLIIKDSRFFDEPGVAEGAIAHFLKTRREVLRNEQPLEQARRRPVLGLWHDTEHGEVVLDVVDSVRSRKNAVELGSSRNQQSVFNLGSFEEVKTGGTGDRATAERYPREASGAPVRAGERPRRDDGRGNRRFRGGGSSRRSGSAEALVREVTQEEVGSNSSTLTSRLRPSGLGGFVVQGQARLSEWRRERCR